MDISNNFNWYSNPAFEVLPNIDLSCNTATLNDVFVRHDVFFDDQFTFNTSTGFPTIQRIHQFCENDVIGKDIDTLEKNFEIPTSLPVINIITTNEIVNTRKIVLSHKIITHSIDKNKSNNLNYLFNNIEEDGEFFICGELANKI